MKHFFLCTILLFGFGAGDAFAQNTKTASAKTPKAPAVKGMTYHKARKIILARGWKPFRSIPENEVATNTDIKSGNGKEFWKRGYVEVEACSGTGEAPCAFEFQDGKGHHLRVFTTGEENPKRKSFAIVSGVEVVFTVR